ncbi:hypothetical protein H5410_012195 [Solanum commersonii]|uniref:Uncharacterized protein n=1 Tax=Solanum commersonii TaxID=4109 RepID=A0A9J6ARR0_SOLCO|nr:hypothetical protein H5410_012195 [Solanum commersonii]
MLLAVVLVAPVQAQMLLAEKSTDLPCHWLLFPRLEDSTARFNINQETLSKIFHEWKLVKAKISKAKQSDAERYCIDQFNYVSTTTQGCSLTVEEVYENMEDQASNPADREKAK